MGLDVICQAKSGMGKTAVFVLSCLHQLEATSGKVEVVVLAHTRELADQISDEFKRFAKYVTAAKVAKIYGGVNIRLHREMLKNDAPNIIVGTPGRVLQLAKDGDLDLSACKHFVLDECDKMLDNDSLDMRNQVQQIFQKTPRSKQVMMYSATLSKEVRPICKKFMQDGCFEIYVDDDTKLTLHGLKQHYVQLAENEKNKKLNDLLDDLEFNQVVIFVRSVSRANELNRLLTECNFPSLTIHGRMSQDERNARFKSFKNFEKRILVSTDVFARGIDIERVNIVINYDMPSSYSKDKDAAPANGSERSNSDTYLHRVGRAGRFGTKGLAISFVSSPEDSAVLNEVQGRFEVNIAELPAEIEASTYMNS